MPIKRTTGRGLVTVATLAVVALICWGLSTTTHVSATNTSSPLPDTKTVAAAPPSAASLLPSELDTAMGALTPEDALLYRLIFEAQKQDDWNKADEVMANLSDRRLVGHVLADRYARRPAGLAEIAEWLG